ELRGAGERRRGHDQRRDPAHASRSGEDAEGECECPGCDCDRRDHARALDVPLAHAASDAATPRAIRSFVIDVQSESRIAPEPAISQSVVVYVPVRSLVAPRSNGAIAPRT